MPPILANKPQADIPTGWLALLGPSSPKAPAACRPRSATFAHDQGPAVELTASLDHGLASNRELLTPHAGSCGSGGCNRLLLWFAARAGETRQALGTHDDPQNAPEGHRGRLAALQQVGGAHVERLSNPRHLDNGEAATGQLAGKARAGNIAFTGQPRLRAFPLFEYSPDACRQVLACHDQHRPSSRLTACVSAAATWRAVAASIGPLSGSDTDTSTNSPVSASSIAARSTAASPTETRCAC